MKNAKSMGYTVTFTAPEGGVSSGTPVVVGALVLIPAYSAGAGEECEGVTKGVFDLPKVASDAPTQFQAAYWNGSAVTTAADDGNTESPQAYTKIGVFMEALESDTAEADIRLDGVSL